VYTTDDFGMPQLYPQRWRPTRKEVTQLRLSEAKAKKKGRAEVEQVMRQGAATEGIQPAVGF